MATHKSAVKKHIIEFGFHPASLKSILRNHLTDCPAQLEKILGVLGISRARLSIVFLSDASMRKLNRDYLGHDYVTDVVTFDLTEKGTCTFSRKRRKSTCPFFCGEIYICPGEAKRNAKLYGKSFEQELLRYAVHGILHLLGDDDRTDRQRLAMRGREDKLLECCI